MKIETKLYEIKDHDAVAMYHILKYIQSKIEAADLQVNPNYHSILDMCADEIDSVIKDICQVIHYICAINIQINSRSQEDVS